jgi:hypothetical protein
MVELNRGRHGRISVIQDPNEAEAPAMSPEEMTGDIRCAYCLVCPECNGVVDSSSEWCPAI